MREILHTADKDTGNVLCIAQGIQQSLIDGFDAFERLAGGNGKYKGIPVHADRCVAGQTRIFVLSRGVLGGARIRIYELNSFLFVTGAATIMHTTTYHSSSVDNIRRKMDLSETNRLMMNVFDGRIIAVCKCAKVRMARKRKAG